MSQSIQPNHSTPDSHVVWQVKNRWFPFVPVVSLSMALFKNRYRIESICLQGWDYSSPGYYFITICTRNREHLFGTIKKGKMDLSTMGKIAHRYWMEIPNHFSYIRLDQFVVMPDHVHGILSVASPSSSVETLQCNVSTEEEGEGDKAFYSRISPKPGTISAVIRSYKSICTKMIHKEFDSSLEVWQTRFYDRIIRDEDHLNNVRQYIFDNPGKWGKS